MKKATLFLAALAVSTSALAVNGVYWPQEKAGQKILLENKYHDIQILYIQPIRCADGVYDKNSVGFRAISPQNHIVKGVVCGGKVYPKVTTVTEELTA